VWDHVDAWNPSIERICDFRREVRQKRKTGIHQVVEKGCKQRRIRTAKTRSTTVERRGEQERRRRRWGEGPIVQLNCYDIIRGDPSGIGSGNTLARSDHAQTSGGMKSEKGSEGKKKETRPRRKLRWEQKLPPQTIHSSTRSALPFDQFIQGFKAFPRAHPSWLCLVSPPLFFSTFRIPLFLRLLSSLLQFHTPVQRSAVAHGVLMLSSAIFCAADESCRDRPTNASNIPAHRVLPSRGVFSERDTF